jgi:HAD superfamily 5'-nucleotidase-like hydrolase
MRVFANRILRLHDITWIGFDMDYTLACYRPGAFEDLAWQAAVAKLLALGYPAALREVRPDPSFAIRGLVIDKWLGNIVKMDRHGYVGRAYHGTSPLPKSQRKVCYRDQRLGRQKERFVAVDTFFNLPEVNLFAHLVDLTDALGHQNGDKERYSRLWNDVHAVVDASHRDGSIKDVIRADPDAYLLHDAGLVPALEWMRKCGKRLFLLTNSDHDYTCHIMSHVFRNEAASTAWSDMFDFVIVDASKPGFFQEELPLVPMVERRNGPCECTPGGRVYSRGGQGQLQSLLACAPDEVLYVGDNIFADIVRSRKSSGWRTALIAPELENDIRVRREWRHHVDDLIALYEAGAHIDEELAMHRNALLAQPPESGNGSEQRDYVLMKISALSQDGERVRRLRTESRERCDRLFNPFWGSAFQERYGPSRFASQIEDYACVYTSRVSNLLRAGPEAYYAPPFGVMPHF